MSKGDKRFYITIMVSVLIAVIGWWYFNESSIANSSVVRGDNNQQITNSNLSNSNNQQEFNITNNFYKGTVNVPESDTTRNDKDFLQSLKDNFNCYQDEGIKCTMNYISVVSPTGEEMENAEVFFRDKGGKEHMAYIKKLDAQGKVVAQCFSDFKNCEVFSPYNKENNGNFSPCYIITISDDGNSSYSHYVLNEFSYCD